MTSQESVEGGLAEPAGLEPAQGTLALSLDGPGATRADWEKAAAAVLRKAGRLRDDEPDEAAWAELTRTTLDGIPLSPLGTPTLTEGVAGNARPAVPGGRDPASSCAATTRSS
jgi:methylmalonyl-CoA mutase